MKLSLDFISKILIVLIFFTTMYFLMFGSNGVFAKSVSNVEIINNYRQSNADQIKKELEIQESYNN